MSRPNNVRTVVAVRILVLHHHRMVEHTTPSKVNVTAGTVGQYMSIYGHSCTLWLFNVVRIVTRMHGRTYIRNRNAPTEYAMFKCSWNQQYMYVRVKRDKFFTFCLALKKFPTDSPTILLKTIKEVVKLTFSTKTSSQSTKGVLRLLADASYVSYFTLPITQSLLYLRTWWIDLLPAFTVSVYIALRPGTNSPIENFHPWAVLTGFSHAVLIVGGHVRLIRLPHVTRGNYITAYNRLLCNHDLQHNAYTIRWSHIHNST